MKDETGKRYGRLTVICRDGSKWSYATWLCHCDCGKTKVVVSYRLRSGNTKSCGCIHREGVASRALARNYRHGHTSRITKSSTYRTWQAMHRRCTKPSNQNFKYYGAKGIKICDYWDTFTNFLEDMGERPKGKTLDRIDSKSHYMPSNCRWATLKEQNANRCMMTP